MVKTSEQARPLAPASNRPTSSDDEAATAATGIRRRGWLKGSASVVVPTLIVAVVIFAVFMGREPIIWLNNITVDTLELINGTTTPRPGTNMSLTVNVSVKNPNIGHFKYPNPTTALSYRGAVIGRARGQPGKASRHRTISMKFTVDVIMDLVLSQTESGSDIKSGLLSISSDTEVGGRVAIVFWIGRGKILRASPYVAVKLNCHVTINITSQAIQQQECTREVKL